VNLTYLSHSCFLVETSSARLLVDPFLTGNPNAPIAADEVACDYILVTHGHGDHFGDTLAIAERTGATVIATYEIAMYCAGKGCNVHPMHIGGAHTFPFGQVKWTIAHHGAGYEGEGSMQYMGTPAGLLITADGKTIYHAGDTGLFLDMQLIGEMNSIDVALLPIGDNFTMGIDDAAKALEFLKPARAVPMHYGTFDVIDVDPAAFAAKADTIGVPVTVLGINESLTV
jgi:L-ascorbate metabolism protein UlaG (beta-lactamase superfamily)